MDAQRKHAQRTHIHQTDNYVSHTGSGLDKIIKLKRKYKLQKLSIITDGTDKKTNRDSDPQTTVIRWNRKTVSFIPLFVESKGNK